jgi:hypothetical protein
MKKRIIIGITTLFFLWAAFYALGLLFIPANGIAEHEIELSSDIMSKTLTTPKGAKVIPYRSHFTCVFEISGSIDPEAVTKLINESGLFQYYSIITISGTTDDGTTYTIKINKP